MLGMLVELLRRQDSGDHWNFDFQLHRHEGVDDRMRHELVPIDAAIDDEAAGHDRDITTAAGQKLGMQRDLEGARHFVEVNRRARNTAAGHLIEKGIPALVDDLAMPAGLHEGKPLRRIGSGVLIFCC